VDASEVETVDEDFTVETSADADGKYTPMNVKISNTYLQDLISIDTATPSLELVRYAVPTNAEPTNAESTPADSGCSACGASSSSSPAECIYSAGSVCSICPDGSVSIASSYCSPSPADSGRFACNS